jgi:3-oxoacyl-[acyl-carrier-protein] synthase II
MRRDLEKSGPRRVSPFFIPSSLINLGSGHGSITYGFTGPNHSAVTACATGAHAIGDASRLIMFGDADVMVAGGAEAAVCRLGIAGFSSAKALSTGYNDRPSESSRPWDKGRDGFVMGEGAGVVVLEEYEHAKKRGAKILCRGQGLRPVGRRLSHHRAAPRGPGAMLAMKMALKNAGLNPRISTTSTRTAPRPRLGTRSNALR